MGSINQRIDLFNQITDKAAEIMVNRAAKYSGASTTNEVDCNSNIRACEVLGIPATTGVLIRMLDKLARLAHLKGSKDHQDESVLDTIIDLANYSVIFYDVYREDEVKKSVPPPIVGKRWLKLADMCDSVDVENLNVGDL